MSQDIPVSSPPRRSDLGVRTISAIAMVAIAATAAWLGGAAWSLFVALIAAGVLWEWVKLARRITSAPAPRVLWFLAGLIYVGIAADVLWGEPMFDDLVVVLCVVATDIGAYFAGRRFGGPKIAPRISPSKTWAGLAGGMLGAAVALSACLTWTTWRMSLHHAPFVVPLRDPVRIAELAAIGAFVAVIAQTGDFFESWMKRRAGVKDSGSLIPGHGGLFDRVDGLLAVLFVIGLLAGATRFL